MRLNKILTAATVIALSSCSTHQQTLPTVQENNTICTHQTQATQALTSIDSLIKKQMFEGKNPLELFGLLTRLPAELEVEELRTEYIRLNSNEEIIKEKTRRWEEEGVQVRKWIKEVFDIVPEVTRYVVEPEEVFDNILTNPEKKIVQRNIMYIVGAYKGENTVYINQMAIGGSKIDMAHEELHSAQAKIYTSLGLNCESLFNEECSHQVEEIASYLSFLYAIQEEIPSLSLMEANKTLIIIQTKNIELLLEGGIAENSVPLFNVYERGPLYIAEMIKAAGNFREGIRLNAMLPSCYQ